MLIRNLFNIALASMALILSGCNGGVLDPKGQIGIDEKNLIIIAVRIFGARHSPASICSNVGPRWPGPAQSPPAGQS
mgnify:CR=1 FL=1